MYICVFSLRKTTYLVVWLAKVQVCVRVRRRFSFLSSNEGLVAPLLSQTSETFVKCALSSCLQLFLPSHGDTHYQITPHLPHHSFYFMNIHQTAEGDVSPFSFFYPSSRSSFPECFLGALELQWHCRSRVGVAETRCRSSLGDFSQSIASVSSQMICTLWAFRSGGFLWALINTRGEFANADFSLDVWSSCRAACKQNIVAQKVRGFLIGLWIRVIGACTPTESYPICSVFCVSSPASLMMILEHLCRRQQSPTHKKRF